MAATAAAAAGRDAIDAMDVDGAAPRAAVPGPQQLFLALASGSVEAIANIRRHADDWNVLATPFIPEIHRVASIAPDPEAALQALLPEQALEVIDILDELWGVDFDALSTDAEATRRLWVKQCLDTIPSNATAASFESASAGKRMRMVLVELLRLDSMVAPEAARAAAAGQDAAAAVSQPLFAAETHYTTVLGCIHALVIQLPRVLPFERAMRILLLTSAVDGMALGLIRNRPSEAAHVVSSLVTMCAEETADTWQQRRCVELLERVCALAPHLTTGVRDAMVKRRLLPAVVLRLGFTVLDDFIEFILGIVYDREDLEWLIAALNAQGAHDACVETVKRMVLEVAALPLSATNHQRLCGLMRTVCVLFRPGAVAKCLTTDEVAALASCVTRTTPATPAGDRFVTLALCVVATCPVVSADAVHSQVAVWLTALVSALQSRPGAGYAEMVRLMAIHFWTGDIRAAAGLVRERLGFHIDIPVESLKRVSELFTKQVFPEEVLAMQVLASEPTEGLGVGVSGIPPIHGVYHVLNARIFVKQKIQPRHWILKQVLRASQTAKVHWALPDLLTSFADFCIAPKGTALSGNERPPRFDEQGLYTEPLERIPEASITTHLNKTVGDGGNPVAQVLLVYYVLMLNEAAATEREAWLKGHSNNVGGGGVPHPYSETFTRALPVKRLLIFAESNPHIFEDVFPTYLALALDAYPELFHTLHAPALAPHHHEAHDASWDSAPATESHVGVHADEDRLPLSEIHRALQGGMEAATVPAAAPTATRSAVVRDDNTSVALCHPTNAPFASYAALVQLESLDDTQLVARMESLLKGVLGPTGLGHPDTVLERRLEDVFLRLWHRLAAVSPQQLWTSTLRWLRAADPKCGPRLKVTGDTLLEDPLEVLRIGRSVLRRPMVLDMVIHILRSCLVGAERRLARGVAEAQMAVQPGHELHAFAHDPKTLPTMINAVYSASVQILLEVCLADPPTTTGGVVDGSLTADALLEEDLQEVRIKVCNFVHQVFIEKPALVRLVHFQGYPSELIPVLCVGVPSMHVCGEFLEELLEHSAVEKQVFAVQVLGSLAKRYTIPKMLTVAKLVLGKGQDMCENDSDTRYEFFAPTLPAIAELCSAFPLLSDNVLGLLMKLKLALDSEIAVLSPLASKRAMILSRQVSQTVDTVTSHALMDGAL
eukprot:m.134526 g.134526  ORF g.134526 m.134526 type:complete len:1174 (-) comp11389_c0_seq2:1801-5322(-)